MTTHRVRVHQPGLFSPGQYRTDSSPSFAAWQGDETAGLTNNWRQIVLLHGYHRYDLHAKLVRIEDGPKRPVVHVRTNLGPAALKYRYDDGDGTLVAIKIQRRLRRRHVAEYGIASQKTVALTPERGGPGLVYQATFRPLLQDCQGQPPLSLVFLLRSDGQRYQLEFSPRSVEPVVDGWLVKGVTEDGTPLSVFFADYGEGTEPWPRNITSGAVPKFIEDD